MRSGDRGETGAALIGQYQRWVRRNEARGPPATRPALAVRALWAQRGPLSDGLALRSLPAT